MKQSQLSHGRYCGQNEHCLGKKRASYQVPCKASKCLPSHPDKTGPNVRGRTQGIGDEKSNMSRDRNLFIMVSVFSIALLIGIINISAQRNTY